jgi:hypothetical protein
MYDRMKGKNQPTSIYEDIGKGVGTLMSAGAPLTVEQMAIMTKKEKEEYERKHRKELKTTLPTY